MFVYILHNNKLHVNVNSYLECKEQCVRTSSVYILLITMNNDISQSLSEFYNTCKCWRRSFPMLKMN